MRMVVKYFLPLNVFVDKVYPVVGLCHCGSGSRDGMVGELRYCKVIGAWAVRSKIGALTTWEVVWAEILSVASPDSPCELKREYSCCNGVLRQKWNKKFIEEILSVVSMVVAGILSLPLPYLPLLEAVLYSMILFVRLWLVSLLCVHVSGFVQIASNFWTW